MAGWVALLVWLLPAALLLDGRWVLVWLVLSAGVVEYVRWVVRAFR